MWGEERIKKMREQLWYKSKIMEISLFSLEISSLRIPYLTTESADS